MSSVVGVRSAACDGYCSTCSKYRRCAVIWIDRLDGVDVRKGLRICSSCCRHAWEAAKDREGKPHRRRSA